MSRPIHLALALSFIMTNASLSQAQNQRTKPASPRDQVYVFDDDPLGAVGLEERGARLRVKASSGHGTLIRPRTHFVSELTRSVENL